MIPLRQSWFTLSCLQLSGILSLPLLLVGYYQGLHHSLLSGAMQIVLGNAILFGLSLAYLFIIDRHKLVTVEFAQRLFGFRGSLICALSLILSLIGWSALQVKLIMTSFGESCSIGLAAVLAIYYFTARDLSYLAKLNKCLLPIILLCVLSMLISLPQSPLTPIAIQSESFKMGLLLVVTAGSGMVFDLPSFYRHARSFKDGLISLVSLFLLFLPAVELLGIYISLHYPPAQGQESWIRMFIQGFSLPVLMFLVMSGMLGTCLNLYSASMALNRSLGLSYRKGLLICAMAVLLLININFEKYFSAFIEVINLSAEIIAILTLVYALLRGYKILQPTKAQQRMHFFILCFLLLFAVSAKLYGLSLFQDLFLDTAFLACTFMFCAYSPFLLSRKI